MERDKNSVSIKISRVPLKTYEIFTKFAQEEFCNDYGMALKWLVDNVLNDKYNQIIQILSEHERIINQLLNNQNIEKNNNSKNNSQKAYIKLLNGKKIEVGSNE